MGNFQQLSTQESSQEHTDSLAVAGGALYKKYVYKPSGKKLSRSLFLIKLQTWSLRLH